MSTSVIAIIVVVFLFLMNVKVALICMGTFTMIFAAIYLLVKPILSRLSKQRVNANTNRFKNLKETVAGVKTFKVHNTLHYFYQRYEKVSHIISKIQPKVSLIGVAPKNLMDIILFGSIILFVLFFIISERDIKTAIPLLSVYAIAGYKLLPAIEQVFKAMVNIKHAESSIELLRKDFNSIENDIILPSHSERIDFLSTIQFDNVSYQYEGAHHPTLNKINFTILKGSKVAFVGETGSGKTTLIDILVGLLPPSQGRIYIDENMINDHNLISWQNNLCYVAQDVFLFDEDLEQNVALNKKSTSMEKLYKILDIVQLRDFVESLEHKHKTRVGEMGVKLSGGQKQRIGLARALYRNPEVLILDEATNALDVKTEKEFFQSLEKHFPDITLIIITHRLSTIKNLDCIYFLSHGKIIESGNYFELKSRNVHFNEMISIS
jgi:ATP-binding cassette subfamily C protein